MAENVQHYPREFVTQRAGAAALYTAVDGAQLIVTLDGVAVQRVDEWKALGVGICGAGGVGHIAQPRGPQIELDGGYCWHLDVTHVTLVLSCLEHWC